MSEDEDRDPGSRIAIIREVYDSDSAHETFELELERALERGVPTIVIEPTTLGDETARWIAVGNCLHKTAVLAGFGAMSAGLIWHDTAFLCVPLGTLSLFCTGVYTASWQFDPCCKYQVECDSNRLSRLPLQSLSSASPVVLAEAEEGKERFQHDLLYLIKGDQSINKLMAGSWVWQGSQQQVYSGGEAGTHNLYHHHQHQQQQQQQHYSLATHHHHHHHQHVPQPQPCYCSFNFGNTIGYAPLATSYATCVPTSCVGVGIPLLKRPAVPHHQQQLQPAIMGHVNSTPEKTKKSESQEPQWNQMEENEERDQESKPKRRCLSIITQATINQGVKNPQRENNEPNEAKEDYQQATREYNDINGSKLVRSRRMTRRVGGKRTPQPYQRRKGRPAVHKRPSIQSSVLHVPVDGSQRVCRAEAAIHQKQRYNLASDYEEDVMQYMLEVEGRHHRGGDRAYLDTHPTVTQRNRAILVDWIIQVQTYLGLKQETLYQTVALVDRVLSIRRVALNKLQLLAVTALFIVAKMEESQPLKPLDLLNLTLNSYTLEEMLSLERQVLCVLEFDLTYADPTIFLNYFLHLTCSEEDALVVECAGFVLELVMIERWPLLTRPSLLAAAAVHSATSAIHPVISSVLDSSVCYNTLSPIILLMPTYFCLSEEDIISTSLRLLEALANRRNLPFKSVEEKYSSHSQHSGVGVDKSLQPSSLLHVLQQVRSHLVTLKAAPATVVITKPTYKVETDSVDHVNSITDSTYVEYSEGSEVLI
ncbi:hypothetical protein Pmani_004718 [Petrolisthes manimaculis]|uniref:Cyclin-like domain-containing protein n=1 Tax=Petrolisthes manimaculis TaxID=1843537 RepID=A0AAE1QDR8_9EUCA|nr:hypothetical protein Pmani_004718 [Petrolisthes manimaculis]